MNKLAKWLKSLQPKDFTESNTTSSVYYIIEGLKIRLADHFTPNPKNCDLQIICPINDPTIYVVTIKEGLQILGYKSLNEVQDFITDYALMTRIKVTSEEMKLHQIDLKQNQIEEDPIKAQIINGNSRTSPEFWPLLSDYIARDCPKYKDFTKGQKKACKNLLSTSKAYKDCINLINTVSESKNCDVATMVKFFEPFINEHLSHE